MRLTALALALLALGGCADSRTPTSTTLLSVGDVPIRARVVTTRAARHAGLMGVRALEADAGMLFVYPRAKRRRFWMEGCLIPLDIAFLDDQGTVLLVDTLDPPAEGEAPARTRLSPPAYYVLELRAGFFAEHRYGRGTRVRIPASVRRSDADP